MKIILTVEMDVKPNDLNHRHTPTQSSDWEMLKKELLNQLVKIKSGIYENALVGYVTGVSYKQTIPRKL